MTGWYEPIPLPDPKSYLLGCDLGQSNDPSALVGVEQAGRPGRAIYRVGHVERVPLKTRYPDVVTHVRDVVAGIKGEQPTPRINLIVDRTGVGRAVGDLMTAETVGVTPVLVTIHGGDAVSRADDGGWRVPKRELASVIQKLLQTGRLEFASDEPLLKQLKEELTGFHAKIKLTTGHVSFEAGEDWRSAPHDDLVLSLALAVWAGEAGIGQGTFEAIDGEAAELFASVGW